MRRLKGLCVLGLLLSGCDQPPADGRVEGAFAPGSRFALLRMGMSKSQVEVLIGQPQDIDAHITGKRFIPLYFGGDQSRTVSYYRGQGRLEFADRSLAGSAMTLVTIMNDAAESGISR